jgi:hypothetical protein
MAPFLSAPALSEEEPWWPVEAGRKHAKTKNTVGLALLGFAGALVASRTIVAYTQ